MNITGRITSLVMLALIVFFVIKYVFPVLGAVVNFFCSSLGFIVRALPG